MRLWSCKIGGERVLGQSVRIFVASNASAPSHSKNGNPFPCDKERRRSREFQDHVELFRWLSRILFAAWLSVVCKDFLTSVASSDVFTKMQFYCVHSCLEHSGVVPLWYWYIASLIFSLYPSYSSVSFAAISIPVPHWDRLLFYLILIKWWRVYWWNHI